MRNVAWSLCAAVLVSACGGGSSGLGGDAGAEAGRDAAVAADALVGDGGQADGPVPDGTAADSGGPRDAATIPDGATYRNSLSVCWTDASCMRALSVGHGGAWNLTDAPYLSNAALRRAYEIGMDGVKIDVRVTKDDVPVLAHSSPIEYYESLLCAGKKIEESTAEEITSCLRFPSLSERFQRLDEVLDWLRGKLVAQLCVKRPVDYQRTVREIHAKGAADFAFIELDSAAELEQIVPTLDGGDTVWYMVNVENRLEEVDRVIDVIRNPRAFMIEFAPGVDVSQLAPGRLHPAGLKAFMYDDATPISVATIQAYFEGGYDVVSSQNGENNVEARKNVNTARGISPP